MSKSREKIEKIIGFDSSIKNVVVEPETNGNDAGVKIVACGCDGIAFRCSKNASKITDFKRLA